MNTPICDFVRSYARQSALRLHMPGHKGMGPLGIEDMDITEIAGADSLYEAGGIIRESEENASRLFGCATFYSTEGSSLAIRAMLYLALLRGRQQGQASLVLAGRNAHKTFLSAAALLDLDVQWLHGEHPDSYLCCALTPEIVESALAAAPVKPFAVYITSPDYLGNTVDISGIAAVCHRHDALLLVDNAHGAYLRFLPESRHPIDLGADMCCASAHKTLPVLTGGAYLHISPAAPRLFVQQAKNALALFGSTSPSYLILSSLDAANRVLAGGYRNTLAAFCQQTEQLKSDLQSRGFALYGDEPLKMTIAARIWGYTGQEFARLLLDAGIVVEFADPDFVVMMLTPETGPDGLARLKNALFAIPRREAIYTNPPVSSVPERVLRIREALFSASEEVSVKESLGRVLAAATVGCPPAVPIVVCGERIDEHAIRCFEYYGIERCCVVANKK